MKKIIIITALVAFFMSSCDDDTSIIGNSIMPQSEKIITTTQQYNLDPQTIPLDSILVGSGSGCFLGSTLNKEAQSITTCGFLSQYHLQENYQFPEFEKMIKENGKPTIDSCDITIYFDKYYGDPTSTMVLDVILLDTISVLSESKYYYSNMDPNLYINKSKNIIKRIAFNVDGSFSNQSSYIKKKLTVKLPKDFGNKLLNKFYENPSYFKNSYNFIHHVFPGFCFKISNGIGAILKVDLTSLNLYFRFHDKNVKNNDTIVEGLQRFVSTEEVIQSTFIENNISKKLFENNKNKTYIASPAICATTFTIPIKDIIGSHLNDTINQASINLQSFLEEHSITKKPEMLLLLRKKDKINFFRHKVLADNISSFTAPLNNVTQSYLFNNVARLIKQIKDELIQGANITNQDSKETIVRKVTEWERMHPDWNKIEIIPVTPQYSERKDLYTGQSVRTLLRIENMLEPSFVAIQKGSSMTLNIIYSSTK